MMGQQEVLNAVEELGFTTLQELKDILKHFTTPSITHSLTTLFKWHEIETVELGIRRVYISLPLIEQLEEILIEQNE